MSDKSGPDRSEQLAGRLLEGLNFVRNGDNAAAALAFADVHAAPEMIAATDMVDVRIRALTLHGQAILATGGIESAQKSVMEAMRLARSVEDTQGLFQAQALYKQVLARRDDRSRRAIAASEAKRVAATSIGEIRSRLAPHSLALCDALIKKANAHMDVDQPIDGHPLALEALQLAQAQNWLREEVLARLSLARTQPSDAAHQLYEAWHRAERASDFTLVGTVARAATLQGVCLPVQLGPDMEARASSADET
ncbi:MAG: hypothetical protein GWP91_25765 [Rhodobacterales bacterium]|nr:hypothetical protein [Rhodobacterales bacterium]